MTNGKTFLENTIIFDKGLSLEAIGLYAILKHYSTISDFQIRRDHIKSISGYGETAFRRVWKELKDTSLLLENKKRINGKFEYEFTLSTSDKTTKKANEPRKTSNKKINKEEVVEDLEGQISIDDMSNKDIKISLKNDVQSPEAKELSLEEQISKETGCTHEVAQSSVKYAKEKGANNIKSYAIASINKGFTCASTSGEANTYRSNYASNNSTSFNNFEPRDRSNGNADGNMTYEEIEAQLLGWYNNEPEEIEKTQESTAYDFLKKYGIGSAITN